MTDGLPERIRLMLNVLLSFAQFEREVTGERIRDKIAASKRKGLWMGGVPPLGYDVANRLLVVNETEADLVRRIFSEMLTIGSPTRIAQGLASEGITTKAWTTQDGQVRSGTQMDRKYLYKLLRNRIYLGELSHKGSWFPGAHLPVIDHGLWGQVHEVLARDPHVRSVDTQTRESTEALLRGLLFGPSGDPMYPTYASKNKRKYRYYVSKAEMRFGAAGKTHERIPAAEVEAATVNQVITVLSSPEAITAVCKSLELQGVQINEDEIVMRLHQLGEAWEHLYPAERIRIVKLMIERVDLVAGGLKVKWHALGWKELIKEFAAKGIGAELVEMEAA